jgi:hypothetical protein
MSVTYGSTLKNKRMQLVADLIAGKTAAASTGSATTGTLVVGDNTLSGATGVLATWTINTGITGGVSGAVLDILSWLAAATVNASATGTAAKAEVRDNGGNVIVGGLTVGTSGTDIIISPSTSITNGNPVQVTAASITHG